MKTNNTLQPQIVRHGEVILKPVDSIPQGAILKETTKKNIVAHSETGHHHVLEATQDFKIYTMMGDTYIEIPSVATLRHEKTGKDVHTPHKIAPAIYKIEIKKEFNYFSGLLQKVRD
jgi:hypothetical protein